MATIEETIRLGFDAARAALRAEDPDRYFATLFAPKTSRDALFAIYAFNLEVARVRQLISEPLPGEVRLQWWRDAIESGPTGDAMAHPLAAALLTTMQRYNLPTKAFTDLIDSRVFDLYDDLLPSWNDLEGYLGETNSVLFRLASLVLADGGQSQSAAACGHAGVAFGLMGIIRALPWHAQHGQVFLPEEALKPFNLGRSDLLRGRDTPELRRVIEMAAGRVSSHLEATRSLRETIEPEVIPALLPLAPIPAYLAQIRSKAYAPFNALISLPDWRRIWLMWRWRL